MSAAEIRPIDVRHLGRPRVICAWLAGDVLIDPGPASSSEALLDGLAGYVPRRIALTHIHLDHAGATGTLAARWPEVEVAVHERGARHIVDPSRLLESATRLYGDDMERLWGEVLPVPEDRVTVLRGGERLGDLEVAYTPGHASHHVSYWDARSRTVFAGDVAGVRIEPLDYVLAPTPPPDIDIEAWHDSIARLRRWQPERLAITHFGAAADPQAHLDRLDAALDHWAARARDSKRAQFAAALRADVEAQCGSEDARCYQQGAPYEHIYDGLARYWSKRDAKGSR
ncbi:MAG: MBL fold metallo-hydrolase [Solirubrobacteraceae bacterium]|jgi:glyoxylase-like metal-dependent hydrolase (beta-lactamase superfamily II)